MIIKQLVDEDFVNYKKPSMFVGFPRCSWKCEKECGAKVCQNTALAEAKDIEIDVDVLVDRYLNNQITEAVIAGGLEPFDSWNDLKSLIIALRTKTDDDAVVYTGYREEEVQDKIEWLSQFPNIVIKFGRYIPGQQPHRDEVLGVDLISDNQYAKRTGNEDSNK